MRGDIEPPVVPNETLKQATRKDSRNQDILRRSLASIHPKANVRALDGIADLAFEGVEVDENSSISHGKKAFVLLVTAQYAGPVTFQISCSTISMCGTWRVWSC